MQGYWIKTDRVSAYHSASAGHLSFFLSNKHGRDCGSSRCQLKTAEALQGKIFAAPCKVLADSEVEWISALGPRDR